MKDGILYKDHGTTMVFVPPRHPQVLSGFFRVPEGVLCLEEKLFRGYLPLKQVEMPDSVRKIGKALFSGCRNLEYVRFSDSITRIPGGDFEDEDDIKNAMFFECEKLSGIHFPKNLIVLERGTFYGCRITEIDLPEGLKKIQPYPFPECSRLEKIFLPKSLKRVDDAAFVADIFNKSWIYAYEGTAKGLLSSIYVKHIDAKIWVKVLSQEGTIKVEIPVPMGQTDEIKPLLKKAWDGDQLCLDALFQCIPVMREGWQLDQFVLLALLNLSQHDFQCYEKYRHISYEDYGIYLIVIGKMDLFRHFLKRANLSEKERENLLDFCNGGELTQFVSILLEENNQRTNGKGTASIEEGLFDL